MPTDNAHAPIVKAGRAWRKGIRTFIASSHEPSAEQKAEGKAFQEVWSSYPDDNPVRSFYAGDSRAALMPFLAHRHFGDTYKWLIYGDDDTFWFWDGILTMVEDLDPETPYFLTDHLWWSANHRGEATTNPARGAPRCVPCNYTGNIKDEPFKMPQGCPYCHPQLLCDADGGIFNLPPKPCSIPRAPERFYSMHGGAGAILSVGLLRKVNWTSMENCVLSLYSTGGDAYITVCLWEAGYAITDPDPLYHPEGLPMFDPARPNVLHDEDFRGKIDRLVKHLLQAAIGSCKGLCKLEVQRTVSLHMRSRKFDSLPVAAEFMRILADLYDTYTQRPADTSDPAMEGTWQLAAAQRESVMRQVDIALDMMKEGKAKHELLPGLAHMDPKGPESREKDVLTLINELTDVATHEIARRTTNRIIGKLIGFFNSPPEVPGGEAKGDGKQGKAKKKGSGPRVHDQGSEHDDDHADARTHRTSLEDETYHILRSLGESTKRQLQGGDASDLDWSAAQELLRKHSSALTPHAATRPSKGMFRGMFRGASVLHDRKRTDSDGGTAARNQA
ncbi:hypothetical protein WJX72_008195 [[Myrmecia] bisecta]|uniref:Uncharacterized protein n=1 Tax=[Myrmecia] bisecta TaxID=41462 RepID=A0AAW1PE58_9CHLO